MQRIYLDANATTPVLPEVVEAMLPYFTSSSGNPSSAHHSGQRARGAVEMARIAVAKLLHCAAKEVVFTSGGTESNNLALLGVLQPYLDLKEPAHLITTQMEHHAVLYPAESLEQRGIEVTYLAPNREGILDPAAFQAALRPHTRLVSIMMANNETGTIQPIGKVARIAKNYNANILFHTDAVQAAGKLPIDLSAEFKNVDLLSLSGHKMYAPQGIGVLYVRDGVKLAPLFLGGPHERQRRAGTENVPGIVALGHAAKLAQQWLDSAPTDVSSRPEPNGRSGETRSSGPPQLAALRDKLEAGLIAAIPGTVVNGSTQHRTPNTTHLRFPIDHGEPLLYALDMQGVAVSFGSACQSGATEPSHVLLAMGLTPAEARSSLRLSLSRLTTEEEIDRALEIIPTAIARMHALA
jgi:cysteine desulfurase